MSDFILYSIPLLIVLYVAYGRLRGHIKSLEEQISVQQLAQQKLRESNRELQAELKRIECRIGVQDAFTQPSDKPISQQPPKAEEPPRYRVVEEEPALPPPLPVHREVVAEEAAPAPEWEAPPAIPVVAAPSLVSRIPWRDILGRMHLLPPDKSESGETAESQLAAWWVTRIGLVLLIIAAVFFGIYVSQHTPPWLRVLTLGLVSLGTIGLGSKMKDKLEGFGRAIIGGGFALLYFTAFAAFALPATKIIVAPAVGALAQFSALVVAILWSLWKKDQTVATLTLFLGFVSCVFSHSHDLDRFATVGLVMLAATGSFLFAKRGWLTPFITALVGSWSCFGIFVVHDWLRADSPEFFILMGTLVLLCVVFEAGNLMAAVSGDRLRRWLVLGNTSAAALLGYGVTRMAHQDRLSTFYFIFAALYLTFTVIHKLRTTDRSVTVSLFLKSSALLCLGFAAAFSGPVRWLAIAFQAFSLLWTARRSGSRWIAAGFVLVLAASIGWFWRDLVVEPPGEWRWLETFRIAGGLYLVFLTVQLGIHSRWFPNGIGGNDAGHEKQARVFRVVASLVIGITALALSFTPSFPGYSDPVWFLLLLSALIGLVCPLMRCAVPCMVAALPLVSCYIAYAVLPPETSRSHAALLLGVTLILAAFGVSELIRRFWRATSASRFVDSPGALLLGQATLLPFSIALCGMYSLTGDTGIGVFALFPAVACAAVLCGSLPKLNGKRGRLSISFQTAAGAIVLLGGVITCKTSEYFPAVLAIAGLPMLALAKRVRIRNVIMIGALPILGGFYKLWQRFLEARQGDLAHDSINLAVLLLISTSLAIILWKKARTSRLLNHAIWGDALLHALGIVSLHLFFQKHLGEGPEFLAAGLLGLSLFAVSRRFPFRVLGAASWLPVALACVSSIEGNRRLERNEEAWFLTAGLLILAHLLLANHPKRKDALVGNSGFGMKEAISGIAVLAWALIALAAAETPWQAAALTGVALLCSILWRWKNIVWIGHLGLGPLTLAFCTAASLLLSVDEVQKPASWMLTSVLITATGLAVNGMIMAAAVRRILGRKITSASLMPWFHAAGALLVAFVACALDRLVSDNLTAVFWGLSAILLFVSGLFAGLRAYRLTGLIGLVFCTGHIFIWDIQDTFYRIIAFFVIGLVMLAIGFLYHRFRERISALDS
jgi:hypothetical protein